MWFSGVGSSVMPENVTGAARPCVLCRRVCLALLVSVGATMDQ